MCVRNAGHTACDPVDCPDACGDGACDVWEECPTCAQDCGVCREPTADLVATGITCAPGTIDAGGSLDCEITLANRGDEGASLNRFFCPSSSSIVARFVNTRAVTASSALPAAMDHKCMRSLPNTVLSRHRQNRTHDAQHPDQMGPQKALATDRVG